MACKSYLLLLALVVMSVFASARRPPVIVNHEVSESSYAPIHEASEPSSAPIHEASEPVFAPIHEASVPTPNIHGGANEFGNSKVRVDGVEKQDGAATGWRKTDGVDSPIKGLRNEITDDDGNGKLKTDSTQPGPLAGIGLVPVIPGLDGSFHFGIGPIDFGGNIGWGGLAPGYVVPYRQPQPYVVVSPYTSPYARSSPNQPPVTGYGQPSQGHYGPVSGYGQPPQGYPGPYSSGQGNAPPVQYGQPSQGYYGPYAFARGNAPSSSQIRGPFYNRYN